jgi:hypothetical protein
MLRLKVAQESSGRLGAVGSFKFKIPGLLQGRQECLDKEGPVKKEMGLRYKVLLELKGEGPGDEGTATVHRES